MKFIHSALIVSFLVVFSPLILATTFYVDVSVVGGVGDGSSWENAFSTIGAALGGASDTDEIIVAEGVYAEHIDMNGLSVLLSSTDPNDADVVAGTIIDGSGTGTVIACDSGETVDTVINGFTIRNGQGNKSNNAGGIYCYDSYPTIKNCVLINNAATNHGGGLFCYKGAPTILGCSFIGNTATNGSGLSSYESNPVIKNCIFSGNVDSNFGGGIRSYKSNLSISGCSFSQNSSLNGGAAYFSQGSPLLENSIMWGNDSELSDPGGVLTVNYSVIQGGWAGSGSNNKTVDPSFVDPDGIDDIVGTADDDLSLHPFSLCINAGDPFEDYEGQNDVDAQKRVAYGRVDIGADEVFPIGGDLFVDEVVDVQDLMIFAEESWLVDVDLADFAMLAEQWMYGVVVE